MTANCRAKPGAVTPSSDSQANEIGQELKAPDDSIYFCDSRNN